jgi:predicted acylesterase/phospholipase RssA
VPDATDSGGTTADRDELQIALVLNGGVSLAVWMSGAVYELDRLRRAGRGVAGAGDAPGAVLDRVVGAALDLSQQRVAIDLIAGTSAGGINGALLGAAIANGEALTRDDLLSTWLRLGDLDRLLRPTNETDPPSLLEGDGGLYPGLHEVIAKLLHDEAPATGSGTEVSLLLTGTDLDGLPLEVRAGGPLYREHRMLFRFAHPPRPEWAPLAPAAEAPAEAIALHLARAGRSSASFPAAFEGSSVESAPWIRGAGDLPLPPDGPRWRQMMDGGVLDNSPFDPLLGEIDRSPTGAELERTVIYVTPYDDSPPPEGEDAADAPGEPAGVLDTVGWTGALRGELAGVTNYVRFSEQTRRYRASRRTDVTRDLIAGATLPALVAMAESALPAYANARWRSAVGALEPDGPTPPRRPCRWLPASFEGSASPWSWGTAPVRRIAAHAARCLADARAAIPLDGDGGDALRRTLMERERAVRAALEELSEAERVRVADSQARAGDRLEALDASWTDEQRAIRAAVTGGVAAELAQAAAAIAGDAALGPAARAEVIRRLGLPDSTSAADICRALLAAEVVVETGDRGTSAGAELGPELTLVTLRGGSGGGQRQLQVTHALGPEPVRTKTKLLGMSLGHFGGFLFRSWRANDWMFGRLDAADTIARLILSDDRLGQVGATMEAQEREAAATRLAEALARGLPPGDTEIGALRAALGTPDGEPICERVRYVTRRALEPRPDEEADRCRAALRAAVTWRMQAEVLREELPTVRRTVAEDRSLGARLPPGAAGAEPVDGADEDPLPIGAALEGFQHYTLPLADRIRGQWLTAPMVSLVARALFVSRAALGRPARRGTPPSPLGGLSLPLRLLLRVVRGWSSVPLWVATGARKALFPAIARSFLPMILIAYLLAQPAPDWTTTLGILVAIVLGVPWLVQLGLSLASAQERRLERSLRALVPVAAAALGAATGVWARTDDNLDQPAAGWIVLATWLVGAHLVGRIEQRDGIDPAPRAAAVSGR